MEDHQPTAGCVEGSHIPAFTRNYEALNVAFQILNDLKEQLFRLEVEHKQNRISQPEYEKAMTALRRNLDWAMTRKAASAS